MTLLDFYRCRRKGANTHPGILNVVFAFALGLFVLAAWNAEAKASSRIWLNDAQLEMLFGRGAELEIVKFRSTINFTYNRDGSWSADTDSGKFIRGQWRIEKSALCRTIEDRDGKWERLRAAPCMRVSSKGDYYFLGKTDFTLDFKNKPIHPEVIRQTARKPDYVSVVYDETQLKYLLYGLTGSARHTYWCDKRVIDAAINATVELQFNLDNSVFIDVSCNLGSKGLVRLKLIGVWQVTQNRVCLKISRSAILGPAECWRVRAAQSDFLFSTVTSNKNWRLTFDAHPGHGSAKALQLALASKSPTAVVGTAQPPKNSLTSTVDAAAIAAERQRVARERERLAEVAALEREKIDAERRELERMRIQFEKEKLQQQRNMLIRKRDNHAQSASLQDTTPPVIQAPSTWATKNKEVSVSAFATDDGRLARIEINGEPVPFNAQDGGFLVQAVVKHGQSDIRITAFDALGNTGEHVIRVTRSRNIPDVNFGAYHAVVIGINDYTSLPKLNTAIADARAVAKILKEKYHFTVRLLENPDRGDIIDVFDDMREALDESDNLLIYYAGHGWLDPQSRRGYWLPVDAKTDRRSRWLSNSDLTDALQALLAKHVLVVADSCYSGALTRSVKVPDRNPGFVKRMAEKRARVVLSSGGLEPVADSGGGEHSVFAAQFLNALNENGGVMDGTQLFEKVRHKVVLNAQQTPEYSDIRLAGHEGGDFLFVRRD
ncbi:MAG: caspase family protein [Alphaproteobacteria bacterium]|nr:caspase family protein [Alphaproteobacteria bacterium]